VSGRSTPIVDGACASPEPSVTARKLTV
jgi:hypothetical protein